MYFGIGRESPSARGRLTFGRLYKDGFASTLIGRAPDGMAFFGSTSSKLWLEFPRDGNWQSIPWPQWRVGATVSSPPLI